MSDPVCKHPKLCYLDGGLVLGCPACGTEYVAFIRNGWKVDYRRMHDGLSGAVRLDPQQEVRGE